MYGVADKIDLVLSRVVISKGIPHHLLMLLVCKPVKITWTSQHTADALILMTCFCNNVSVFEPWIGGQASRLGDNILSDQQGYNPTNRECGSICSEHVHIYCVHNWLLLLTIGLGECESEDLLEGGTRTSTTSRETLSGFWLKSKLGAFIRWWCRWQQWASTHHKICRPWWFFQKWTAALYFRLHPHNRFEHHQLWRHRGRTQNKSMINLYRKISTVMPGDWINLNPTSVLWNFTSNHNSCGARMRWLDTTLPSMWVTRPWCVWVQNQIDSWLIKQILN